jgi:hypothetical protein
MATRVGTAAPRTPASTTRTAANLTPPPGPCPTSRKIKPWTGTMQRLTADRSHTAGGRALSGASAIPGGAQETPKVRADAGAGRRRSSRRPISISREASAGRTRTPIRPSSRSRSRPPRATQRRPDPDRRRRLRPVQHVRRRRAVAHDGQARRRRAALQSLPHHRAVQPDARRAPHRPQPPLGRVRRHPGGRDGLRRLHRHHSTQRRARSPRCCARTAT